MNIDTIVEIAYKHCLDNYSGGIDTQQLIEQYAKDQLFMTDEQAENYVSENENTEATPEQWKDFYVWYYINEMVLKLVRY